MKTSIIFKSFIALTLLIFTSGFSFSAVNHPENTTKLKSVIQQNIKYPDYAKENMLSGFVLVAFSINENGEAVIKEINSNSDYLKKYVENKLCGLHFEEFYQNSGETYYYRFDFMLLN